MTEGVDVPQTTRTNIINGSITHLTRSRADAIQCPEKWSGTSSSHLSDTVPVQDQEHCCKLEDQDNQEGASSSLHEGLQCHIEVAGEQHSGHLAPDGGWGWAVLTATILVLALTLAFPSCIGIFYTDLQKEFQASNSETSWVPAIMTAVLHAGGPVCSILVESFGCRTTIMLGGILGGLGMVVSSFAQKMADLYISTGVITGSLLYTVLMETVEMSRFQSALGLISIMESVMLLLGPPLAGLLADFTGQYSYVFLFCSVSVSTAGLFIMVSFYWLDRQCSKKEKRSFSEHNYNLKPSISLATDVEGNQVPLQKKMVQDTDTATNV